MPGSDPRKASEGNAVNADLAHCRRTYQQIRYRESGAVSYLEFAFPGGAMSTGQCRRLLAGYRAAELAVMSRNFSGPGQPYDSLRRAFVYKEKPSHTPPHLARHRTHPKHSQPARSRRAIAAALSA